MNLYPGDELVELIERVAQRDESALKNLYDITSPRLFGLSIQVVGKTEWAEDALQESFLQIWRSASDYRGSLSPPMVWLGMIVRSRSLDSLRQRKAQRAQLYDEFNDMMADTIEGNSQDPMNNALCSQQALALHGCLTKLEKRQREVVCLAYMRDLSHGELAQQLSLPLGTVKTWIRRGLDQLRSCMARFV